MQRAASLLLEWLSTLSTTRALPSPASVVITTASARNSRLSTSTVLQLLCCALDVESLSLHTLLESRLVTLISAPASICAAAWSRNACRSW